uniref:Pro-Pol polyprotein n=2 Tax=Lygus hesperus TaxID=30085 RepID=A0A0A9YD88_LYGHE
MLIGADLFWQLIGRDQITCPEQYLSFRESKLGWIVCSSILDVSKSQAYCHLVSSHIATDITLESIDRTMRGFWEIENLNSNQELCEEDRTCEQLLQETTVRDSDGRYVVRMPLKDELNLLGSSKEIAVKRLMLLEKRFVRYPELKAGYEEFIHEYIRLGHMKLDEPGSNSTISYFVPHHPVFKETSSTTKLRVVFDFSCKTSTGHSLNDVSYVGPVIQQPLFSHLIRSRSYQICLCGDLEKMFRQIKISDDQIDLQKILWRDSPDEPIQTYSLLTVSYGTSSASWLATRTLKQLALDYQDRYPESSKVILDHFYMDDCISGANSTAEAIKLKSYLISHLELGKFRIRKWSSNSPEFMDSIPDEDRELKTEIGFDKEATVRTLGLLWLPNVDSFTYSIDHILSSNSLSEHPTKRSVLSTIAKIFDPLGLLGPVISKAKIAMQGLWRQELDWDEPLSNSFTKKWRIFCRTLLKLKGFLIPRKLVAPNSVRIELHGFADASMDAYGACLYLRCIDDQNQVHVNLITSKSRVAPIKTQSLPRLELCGALLLVELAEVVKGALDCTLHQIVFWTDSTVVLSWLQAQPTKWSTFVANRVSKIQAHSKSSDWKHVASADNPADLISRGMFADQLIESRLWFRGPHWLSEDIQFELYGEYQVTSDDELPDIRKQKGVVLVTTAKPDPKFLLEILSRVSSFDKLVRIIAYSLRYLRRRKYPKGSRPHGSITSLEFNEATLLVLRLGQQLMFPQEITDLKKSKSVGKSSRIALLCPFIDKNGLIRVGGRLENANLTPDRKHPIVLSYGGNEDINKLSELIARYTHEKNLHAGPQSLLSFIREEYWPTNGRNLARKVYRKCVVCFKLNPTFADQQMGILPEPRVEPTRPFYRCGVDYAGPIYIRSSSLRKNSPHVKAYIALFVCLCTKAIHVELVEDLTTSSFLACLKRFMSRRGKPLEIHSDNGTTFVGSKRELEDMKNLWLSDVHRDSIVSTLAVDGISWKFIPPRSPNFGGLWESSIKQVKLYLRKAIGKANLTYSEMYTVLTQIEACVNSRPLVPLSSDPNDYSVLTPSHFLIGDQLTAPPEPNLRSLPENRLTRWQLVQRIAQHFWHRWRNEYLHELQRRYKWKSTCNNLQKGTLVLVKEDNSPSYAWSLARVEDTHPGSDGLVRVVTLRCPSGLFKRNIRLLCALPIDDTNSTQDGAAPVRVSTPQDSQQPC